MEFEKGQIMANDDWKEEGSTLEFRNSKWTEKSPNMLWHWIICPKCNKNTNRAEEEFTLITSCNFYCPYCGKFISIDKNIKKG